MSKFAQSMSHALGLALALTLSSGAGVLGVRMNSAGARGEARQAAEKAETAEAGALLAALFNSAPPTPVLRPAVASAVVDAVSQGPLSESTGEAHWDKKRTPSPKGASASAKSARHTSSIRGPI